MLKKTVTYTDFDGNTIREDLYFNLTKAELLTLDKDNDCALEKKLRTLIDQKNNTELSLFFKDLILRSYGVKSDDGRRFIKDAQKTAEFEQSLAFDALFELVTEDEAEAGAFVDGIVAGIGAIAKAKNAQESSQ